jgi:hypothetical protein
VKIIVMETTQQWKSVRIGLTSPDVPIVSSGLGFPPRLNQRWTGGTLSRLATVKPLGKATTTINGNHIITKARKHQSHPKEINYRLMITMDMKDSRHLETRRGPSTQTIHGGSLPEM